MLITSELTSVSLNNELNIKETSVYMSIYQNSLNYVPFMNRITDLVTFMSQSPTLMTPQTTIKDNVRTQRKLERGNEVRLIKVLCTKTELTN